MNAWTPLQMALALFSGLCVATGLGITIATILTKLGWWGGDKAKALTSLEHTVQSLTVDLKADVSEIKADVREIRGTVGRQDVTLAIHGEQLTALSQRLDDEFGRRRVPG